MPVLREVPLKLVDVYRAGKAGKIAEEILYILLGARQPTANISHKTLPTLAEHRQYVRSRPYAAWYLIEAKGKTVGAIYLSSAHEIGIFLFPLCQGKGYGPRAVRMLMKRHPRKRYLANINPLNRHSISMFVELGFHWLQVTYAHESN